MPHIIVEHSTSLSNEVKAILPTLHKALGSQEQVDPARVKSRMLGFDEVLVGENAVPGQIVHVTCKVLTGRDLSLRQAYAKAIDTPLRAAMPDGCKITVDIVEMDRGTYQLD